TMMMCHLPIRPAATCTHRSTTANAAGHRSTAVDHGGDRRSTVAVNAAGHRSTATNHGGDRRSTVVGGLVKVGSGSGPPHGMPRVSHVCPRGIHVDADVDNMQRVGIDPGTSWIDS
nr:hypothetical protein [Tanacetum cinerariifolium]